MKKKAIDLGISSGGAFIAVINEDEALNNDLHALDRIKIKSKSRELIAVLDIWVHAKNLKKNSIGLFEETFHALNIKGSELLEITRQEKPKSIDFIKKKLDGLELSEYEIDQIIKDLISNSLTEIELTYFVSGCYMNGLSDKETYCLTKSIINNGDKLNIKKSLILDKHCIGGIPNNRTSMIIVPIIAALGITIPKTSSRSITSPSGTADTFEALAKVEFSVEKINSIVSKESGCIVWTGSHFNKNLAGADDKLIKLRHPLSLDPEGMLLASILAKKASVKSTHVLIDIPVGPFTKINNLKQAIHLKSKFKKLGSRLGMKIKVIITNGTEPIGNGIGPNLEARDVLYILKRDLKAPKDLEEKSLRMASILLDMAGIKDSYKKAKEVLHSGRAYKKMQQIIKAQEGNPNVMPEDLNLGKHKFDYIINKTGIIKAINVEHISKIARAAGAPSDKSSGIYLHYHIKDMVKKGSSILTIYSNDLVRLENAKSLIKKDTILIK